MTKYIKEPGEHIKCIIPALDQRDWSISNLSIAVGLSPSEKDKPWKT